MTSVKNEKRFKTFLNSKKQEKVKMIRILVHVLQNI